MAVFTLTVTMRTGGTLQLGTIEADSPEKAKEIAMARVVQFNLWQLTTWSSTPPPGLTASPRPSYEITSFNCTCNYSVSGPPAEVTAATEAGRASQAPIT